LLAIQCCQPHQPALDTARTDDNGRHQTRCEVGAYTVSRPTKDDTRKVDP
jgi:hypothetical protein